MTRVKLWLDPQRRHVFVRVRLTTVPDDRPTELRPIEALPAAG